MSQPSSDSDYRPDEDEEMLEEEEEKKLEEEMDDSESLGEEDSASEEDEKDFDFSIDGDGIPALYTDPQQKKAVKEWIDEQTKGLQMMALSLNAVLSGPVPVKCPKIEDAIKRSRKDLASVVVGECYEYANVVAAALIGAAYKMKKVSAIKKRRAQEKLKSSQSSQERDEKSAESSQDSQSSSSSHQPTSEGNEQPTVASMQMPAAPAAPVESK